MCVSENKLHFLQLYEKMSLIKVALYVLRVKKIHPGSPSYSSQTAAGRGEAELRIFDFKTTWSEFQIPSQNTLAEAIYFRVSSPPQSQSKVVVCVSTPRMYPRSGYFLVIK